jgi:hypothetical protein
MGAGEAGEVILGPSSSQLYANVADAYRRAKVRLTKVGREVIVPVLALLLLGKSGINLRELR